VLSKWFKVSIECVSGRQRVAHTTVEAYRKRAVQVTTSVTSSTYDVNSSHFRFTTPTQSTTSSACITACCS
jgi:hypothetical protein